MSSDCRPCNTIVWLWLRKSLSNLARLDSSSWRVPLTNYSCHIIPFTTTSQRYVMAMNKEFIINLAIRQIQLSLVIFFLIRVEITVPIIKNIWNLS